MRQGTFRREVVVDECEIVSNVPLFTIGTFEIKLLRCRSRSRSRLEVPKEFWEADLSVTEKVARAALTEASI